MQELAMAPESKQTLRYYCKQIDDTSKTAKVHIFVHVLVVSEQDTRIHFFYISVRKDT